MKKKDKTQAVAHRLWHPVGEVSLGSGLPSTKQGITYRHTALSRRSWGAECLHQKRPSMLGRTGDTLKESSVYTDLQFNHTEKEHNPHRPRTRGSSKIHSAAVINLTRTAALTNAWAKTGEATKAGNSSNGNLQSPPHTMGKPSSRAQHWEQAWGNHQS